MAGTGSEQEDEKNLQVNLTSCRYWRSRPGRKWQQYLESEWTRKRILERNKEGLYQGMGYWDKIETKLRQIWDKIGKGRYFENVNAKEKARSGGKEEESESEIGWEKWHG